MCMCDGETETETDISLNVLNLFMGFASLCTFFSLFGEEK